MTQLNTSVRRRQSLSSKLPAAWFSAVFVAMDGQVSHPYLQPVARKAMKAVAGEMTPHDTHGETVERSCWEREVTGP